MRLTVAVLISLALADSASACSHCGIFGRQCRVVPKQVVVKRQAVQYAYQQPQSVTNLSIINTYPPGSSQYGVAQLNQVYQPNPDLAVTLSARIAENALQPLRASIEAQQQAASRSLELQRLALATEHLRMAMGSDGTSQSSSLNLNVNQGGGATRSDPAIAPPPAPQSLVRSKCAQCHGSDLQAPKAGLYYDLDVQIDASQAMRAIAVINGHDVPEPMDAIISALTESERCQLAAELTALWRQ